MPDLVAAAPPAAPRKRGRRPRDMSPLPQSRWVSPEFAAAHIGVSLLISTEN